MVALVAKQLPGLCSVGAAMPNLRVFVRSALSLELLSQVRRRGGSARRVSSMSCSGLSCLPR